MVGVGELRGGTLSKRPRGDEPGPNISMGGAKSWSLVLRDTKRSRSEEGGGSVSGREGTREGRGGGGGRDVRTFDARTSDASIASGEALGEIGEVPIFTVRG